jgi:4,5-DOPA dioxygenase extradiol
MTPTIFIGHGSPMNAIEDNQFTQNWKVVANSFPKPKAILVISAHWETHGTLVADALNPETIHDFSGFPDELSQFQYPIRGYPALAQELATKLGIGVDSNMGLDH